MYFSKIITIINPTTKYGPNGIIFLLNRKIKNSTITATKLAINKATKNLKHPNNIPIEKNNLISPKPNTSILKHKNAPKTIIVINVFKTKKIIKSIFDIYNGFLNTKIRIIVKRKIPIFNVSGIIIFIQSTTKIITKKLLIIQYIKLIKDNPLTI